jgi:hypothetical protein
MRLSVYSSSNTTGSAAASMVTCTSTSSFLGCSSDFPEDSAAVVWCSSPISFPSTSSASSFSVGVASSTAKVTDSLSAEGDGELGSPAPPLLLLPLSSLRIPLPQLPLRS